MTKNNKAAVKAASKGAKKTAATESKAKGFSFAAGEKDVLVSSTVSTRAKVFASRELSMLAHIGKGLKINVNSADALFAFVNDKGNEKAISALKASKRDHVLTFGNGRAVRAAVSRELGLFAFAALDGSGSIRIGALADCASVDTLAAVMASKGKLLTVKFQQDGREVSGKLLCEAGSTLSIISAEGGVFTLETDANEHNKAHFGAVLKRD